jgi:curved DNA-binding protein CbpA
LKAPLQKIREKYFKKIRVYHTDLLESEEKKEFYLNRCNDLNQAYSVLSNPKKRLKYDLLGFKQFTFDKEFDDKSEEEMRKEIQIQKMSFNKLKRDEQMRATSNMILKVEKNESNCCSRLIC